jgi:hypothetical protein
MYDQPSSFRGQLLLIFILGISIFANVSGLLSGRKPLLNRFQCISHNQILHRYAEIKENNRPKIFILEKRALPKSARHLASKETQKEIFPSNIVNHHEDTDSLLVRPIKNNITNVFSKLYLISSGIESGITPFPALCTLGTV